VTFDTPHSRYAYLARCGYEAERATRELRRTVPLDSWRGLDANAKAEYIARVRKILEEPDAQPAHAAEKIFWFVVIGLNGLTREGD